MFNLILFILIIYLFYSRIKNLLSTSYSLLNRALEVQQFSNVSNVYSSSNLSIIRADNAGENYIFGVKPNNSLFTTIDIDRIYEFSQNLHIHSIVIATTTPIPEKTTVFNKIKYYGIEIWDASKLTALAKEISSANSSHTYSVLKTSDTSDDTCTIDSDSFDPIQEVKKTKITNLFSNLFNNKPDRL